MPPVSLVTPSTKLAPGQKAPPFNLPDKNPASPSPTLSLESLLKGSRGAVVLWLCNHCPYVVGSVERIVSLANETNARGVHWAAICSNDDTTHPEDSPVKMGEYAKKWRLPFPYLHDQSQAVARAYGAERTPEIFLLDPEGVCVYEGALDDSPKDPTNVRDRPLKDAIEDLLARRPVKRAKTAAIGCTIKWKQA